MFSFINHGNCVYFVFIIFIVHCHSVYSDIEDSSDNEFNLSFHSLRNNSDYDALQLYNISNDLIGNNITRNNSDTGPINTVSDEVDGPLVVELFTRSSSVLQKDDLTNPVILHNFTEKSGTTKLASTTLKVTKATTSKPMIEKNSTCHDECLSALDQMNFTRSPTDFYFEIGTTLTLECSIPLSENYTAAITWLFQGVCPPVPQCSLTTQETLPSCSNFALTDHFTDVNYTAGYMKEILILKQLDQKDSGNYICMVELTCCSASHVMDKSMETEQSIVIYYENYKLELGILCGVIVFLVLLIVIGTVLQNRHRKRFIKIDLSEVQRPILDDVLHIPILERKDSFDDSDQEWDDDKR